MLIIAAVICLILIVAALGLPAMLIH